MPRISLQNCTLTFKDGTPTTPLSYPYKVGDGTVSWSEKRPLEYMKNRGKLDSVRLADEEPMDVKLDAVFEFIKSRTGENGSAVDCVKRTGLCASWVSVDSDTCNPYAVNIEIFHQPVCTSSWSETITLPSFRYENIDFDPKTAMISITGKCNVTGATVIRTTQT